MLSCMVPTECLVGQRLLCRILPVLLKQHHIPTAAAEVLAREAANRMYQCYTYGSLSGFVLGAENIPEPSSCKISGIKRILEDHVTHSVSSVLQKTSFAYNKVLTGLNDCCLDRIWTEGGGKVQFIHGLGKLVGTGDRPLLNPRSFRRLREYLTFISSLESSSSVIWNQDLFPILL